MTREPFSPEFLLTAACSRWPPSAARTAAIRAAVAAGIDWQSFLSTVKRQRVVGLVCEALAAAPIEVPKFVIDTLASANETIARQNLLLAAETVRLQNVLARSGITALVLKGAAIAQQAYGAVAAKQTRDIDLLVPSDRAEAAIAVLERDGYALSLPANQLSAWQRRALVRYAREVELVHPRRKMRVELKWRAADNRLLLAGVDAHSPAQSVALSGGLKIDTLASDDLFAYLCVHGAHHAWARLKWLADLNAWLATGGADIGQLYRHAQRIGAGACAGQALLLCRQLLGLELPAPLVEALQADRRVAKLVAIAVAEMTAAQTAAEKDRGVAGVARSVRNQFLLGRGFAFYATQCRVAAAGPTDIISLPLPRRWHFLYPLVRLPLWLWRRTGGA